MVESNEKAQKAANAIRKSHYIIQLGSRRCCEPPADSRQTSGGVQGAKPQAVPRSLDFMYPEEGLKPSIFLFYCSTKIHFQDSATAKIYLLVKRNIFSGLFIPLKIALTFISKFFRISHTTILYVLQQLQLWKRYSSLL